MTMSMPAHPDPERLAALAGADPDALADTHLQAHVNTCPSCALTTAELRTLHSALAELPDLVPSRPIQFLPPVPEPAAPRAGLFGLRRAFAPLVTAGMVLLVVGSLGTIGTLGGGMAAAPAMENSGGGAAPPSEEATDRAASPRAQDLGSLGANPGYPAPSGAELRTAYASPTRDESGVTSLDNGGEPTDGLSLGLDVGRATWVALAAAGLGLIALAFVLRRSPGTAR